MSYIPDDKLKFDNAISSIAKLLPSIMHDYLGVQPKSKRYSSKRIRSVSAKLWAFFSAVAKIQPIQTTDSPEVKYQKMLEYDKAFRHLIRIPKGMSFIEYLATYYQNAIISSFRYYLPKTDYRKYVKEVNEITLPLVYPTKNAIVKNFFQEFDNTSDAQVLLQATYNRFLNEIKTLKDRKKILTKHHIDKLVNVYIMFAGLYEKLIRVALGLSYIRENGKLKPYLSFDQPLANNVRQLAKRYPHLAGINPVIRNSIAHHSFIVHYAQRTIDFSDRKKMVTITLTEFLKETRELSARVMTLLFVQIFLQYQNFHLLSAEYQQLKSILKLRHHNNFC